MMAWSVLWSVVMLVGAAGLWWWQTRQWREVRMVREEVDRILKRHRAEERAWDREVWCLVAGPCSTPEGQDTGRGCTHRTGGQAGQAGVKQGQAGGRV